MIPFPKGKFKTILADPPWPEHGGGKIVRGSNRHYPLMKVSEIVSLPVGDLAHPDGCHLYLWVTNNYLQDGLKVMNAWGFRYVTIITWAKMGKPGLGQYFRGLSEHCLFGVRGKLPYRMDEGGKRLQGVTMFACPRSTHSAKPLAVHGMAEDVSHGPRIELFARSARKGWSRWGLEAP